jgi:diacylglycerol kinase family enzyme
VRPPIGSRISASGALVFSLATMVVLIVFTARNLPYVVAALLSGSLAVSSLWIAATNRRFRWWASASTVLFVAGVVASLIAVGRGLVAVAIAVAGIVVSSLLGGLALHWEIRRALVQRWRRVPAVRRGVVLMNPASGDGTVVKVHLVDEARRRGLVSVLLEPGDDLEELAESAVREGADALGMAGGDGSQAVVAAVAARHGLPFVCIPAGTRNHFALDLGIDRNDAVKALDAYGPARESTIDMAEVNGQAFVNNVSLGFYAHLVASGRYREAKQRTVVEMLPELLGPDAAPSGLTVEGPSGQIVDAQLVEVSNNPYTLHSVMGFGSRPRLDTGTLGVATLTLTRTADVNRLVALELSGHPDRFGGCRQWTARRVEARGPRPLAVAIDGESRSLEPPLEFAIRPRALRVRIANGQSGASPAFRVAPLSASTLSGLFRVVRGRPSGIVGGQGGAA